MKTALLYLKTGHHYLTLLLYLTVGQSVADSQKSVSLSAKRKEKPFLAVSVHIPENQLHRLLKAGIQLHFSVFC
jgi:hypothetical protein